MSNKAVDALRANGHRVTNPRLAVWAVLQRANRHLTVDEVHQLVRKEEGNVNVASVYRSLTLFEELGMARQTNFGESANHWEVAHPDEHFHLICRDCDLVEHHEGTLVAYIIEHLTKDHDFVPDHVNLSVTGMCTACREPDGENKKTDDTDEGADTTAA